MSFKENTLRKTIDLSGPDGNVFFLLASAARLAKQLEYDGKAIQKEMMSADYLNALYVFNREFGEFIDLELPDGITIEDIHKAHLRATVTDEVIQDSYSR